MMCPDPSDDSPSDRWDVAEVEDNLPEWLPDMSSELEGFEWREVPGQDAYDYRSGECVIRVTAQELRSAEVGMDVLIRDRMTAAYNGEALCYCDSCTP